MVDAIFVERAARTWRSDRPLMSMGLRMMARSNWSVYCMIVDGFGEEMIGGDQMDEGLETSQTTGQID